MSNPVRPPNCPHRKNAIATIGCALLITHLLATGSQAQLQNRLRDTNGTHNPSLEGLQDSQQFRQPPKAEQAPPTTEPLKAKAPAAETPATSLPLPGAPKIPVDTVGLTDSIDASAASITVSTIELRESELKDVAEIDDENRKRIEELYAKAKASLERATFFESRQKELQGLIDSAESRNKNILSAIEQARTAEPDPASATDDTELEQTLGQQQEEVKKRKTKQRAFDEQIATRVARRNEIRKRIPEIETEIEEGKKQTASATVSGDSPILAQAKRIELLCHLRVLTREKPALEAELRLYEIETALNLLSSQRNLNALELDTWTEQVQLTSQALQDVREKVAGTTVANAVEAAKEVPAALRPVAEASRLLAEKNQQIARNIQQAEVDKKRAEAKLDNLKRMFATTLAKEEAVGLPASVGAMLRNQRAGLPDVRSLRSSAQARSSIINEIQLEIFDLNEEIKRLVHLEDEAQLAILKLAVDDPSIQTTENITIAKDLLRSRSKVVESLHRNQTTYFNCLTDTSIAEQGLIREATRFREYINERVLWIRSHPSLVSWRNKTEWTSEKATLSRWKGLPAILRGLVADAKQNQLTYVVFALFAGLLAFARSTFAARRERIAEVVKSSAYSHFSPSFAALINNALSCLLLPTILGFFGWRIRTSESANLLSTELGRGLLVGAIVALPLSFFSKVFVKNGLADAHFDWLRKSSTLMRSNIRWGQLLLLPLVVVGTTMFNLQATTAPGMAHRLLFVVACGIVAVFLWRVLHPTRGVPNEYLQSHAGGWLERLQFVWFFGLLTIPISLAALAILGYSYTAHELAWRGFVSLSIVGFLWILHGLSMRLLLVYRRRLSVDRARRRYAEYQRQQQLARNGAEAKLQPRTTNPVDEEDERIIANLPGVSVTSNGLVMEADPIADLRANTEQSRRFVSTLLVGTAILMLWMTWHNVLPALGFLEQWPLWNSSKEIAETFTNEAGVIETRTREVADPVTIADVFLAIFVAIVGLVAARDLPGILELAILQKLPLERSVRYAITTISSYVAFAVGLFVAFRLIGLRWQQIQWMATALTFGLAFGLQEMFANFVAGIILLFERPIRVGDIVTIDEITGVVSRVRMRATTVTNFDRKDYIVPNKDFITGRMLNWTLSDHVNRICIEIGVAYGADTELAKSTLIQIASDHQLVTSDPPPTATFEQFDASSLRVVLRCFIAMANMPMRLEVIDELHTSINAAFKEADIEIAFPQQDLNIRSMPSFLKSA